MEVSAADGIQPSTSTNPSDRRGNLKKSDWLKLISNIAIPLIIGIFTVVVSIHQENVAKSNRDKDTLVAAERRELDLATALLRREDDKKAAKKIRDDDKEIARLQRELDLNMTNEKLIQEAELAEIQRNLLESQRTHEIQMTDQNHLNDLALEDERQKEDILGNYQRQLAILLLNYGSTFDDPYSRLRFVIQMKTRTALRLLNPARRTILVRTLHQVDLFKAVWKKDKSLLYRTNVSGAHFGHPPDNHEYDIYSTYNYLDIEAADARYASFRHVQLGYSSHFAYSNFDYTDWSYAELTDVCFQKQTTMNEAIFFQTSFADVCFDTIKMDRVSFQSNNLCDSCLFDKTSLIGVRLDNSHFSHSEFTSLPMTDANMSNGSFIGSKFINVILDRVDLSRANLHRSGFYNVSMVNCLLNGTKLDEATFSMVNMTGCTGISSSHVSVIYSYHQVTLPNGTLINHNN